MPTETPTPAGVKVVWSLDKLCETITKKGLLKKPQTAAEIAERIGTGHDGRGIGRALSILVADDRCIKHAERKPRYSKP